MATCEELAAEITLLTEQLIVDNAAYVAASNVVYAHELQLWYAQYNYELQQCDGSGSGPGFAAAAADESESANKPAVFDVRPKLPKLDRTPSEMIVIRSIPELSALHDRYVELSRK